MSDDEMIEKRKYNYGEHIPLDSIPISDTNIALYDFADGSRGLEICLRVMWMHGLKTYSCYPGNKDIFDIAYIVMEENEDVFNVEDYVLDDYQKRAAVIDENNMQIIAGAGTGKTSTLQGKLKYLTKVKGIKEEDIL